MKKIIGAVAACLVVGATGYFMGKTSGAAQQETAALTTSYEEQQPCSFETRANGYSYINPLLECDDVNASRINNTVALELSVKSFITKIKAEGKADFISVYFRDLNNGPWMGINQDENYAPASLLKVPVLIAVLKKAESDPGYLQQKMVCTQNLDNVVIANIAGKKKLKTGKSYTIEQLAQHMISSSDNVADDMLFNSLGDDFIVQVMKDLGINTDAGFGSDFVSVKDYSGFFRMLYNGTYLNHAMSEKALEILSNTEYTQGLVAGVPKQVVVAHKFGERALSDSDVKQLHDCGIVYVNSKPYLLCVMTRGKDFAQLANTIAGVSKLVYNQISNLPS